MAISVSGRGLLIGPVGPWGSLEGLGKGACASLGRPWAECGRPCEALFLPPTYCHVD